MFKENIGVEDTISIQLIKGEPKVRKLVAVVDNLELARQPCSESSWRSILGRRLSLRRCSLRFTLRTRPSHPR